MFLFSLLQCITLHLSTLNFMPLVIDQFWSASKSSFTVSSSLTASTLLAIFVSSANIFIFDLMPLCKSLMYIKNRIDPFTEPCGTPLYTLSHCDISPLITTRCFFHLNNRLSYLLFCNHCIPF